MKTLKCSCGCDILVDNEMFDTLSLFVWSCNNGKGAIVHTQHFYNVCTGQRITTTTNIARYIIDLQPNQTPDHIDGDIHDNQKHNLRPATRSQQGANRRIPKNNQSGYKGVVEMLDRVNKPWRAMIKVNGKNVFLGYFTTPIEAAQAYDKAALKHFGKFASLNFATMTE